MQDKFGRTYAKLCDCKPGTKLEADSDFECIAPGSILEVKSNDGLYIPCLAGEHYLSGQLDSGYLIGLYPVSE